MKIENKDFRREDLEALSSQQLDDLLQTEIKKDSKDTKVILHILSILEKRETGDPANDVDVSEAWEAFEQSCANARDEVKLLDKSVRKGRKSRRWMSAAAAAAVVAIVLMMYVPQAMGADNIFEMIGRWTKSVFQFSDPSGTTEPGEEYVFKTDNSDLQQIYDAVAALGVTDPVVPTWIPEGYVMEEFKVMPWRKGTKVYACFVSGEDCLTIAIEIYDDKGSNRYTKDEVHAKEWEMAGVTHYIMNDEDYSIAVWSAEKLECMITVDRHEDVLYDVLRSIYN